MSKELGGLSIAQTKSAYRDMAGVADERLLMKFEELTIKLAQTIGQLFVRKHVLEQELQAVNDAIAENRGASTLMKELQDFQSQLMKAHEQERLAREARMQKHQEGRDEESRKRVGQRDLDS